MTPTTPIPDGSVIITPTEVYAEVRATREAVRELGGKLDALPAQVTDHENRLRRLEQTAVAQAQLEPLKSDVEALKRARWPLPAVGALTGIGALAIAVWQGSGR